MALVPYSAEGGRDAIYAAGGAVNALDLDDTDRIRRAIPKAGQAAFAIKKRSESTDWKTGRYTGLPIAIYQNWLYEQNREWHFTDGTLCVLWCIEFPDAKSDYPANRQYIASTRRDYNAGRHQADAPLIPCVGYDRTGAQLGTGASSRPGTAAPGRPVVKNPVSSPPLGRATPVPSDLPAPAIDQPKPLSRFVLASDPDRSGMRLEMLDNYMSAHVLAGHNFICSHFRECTTSHRGEFFEGQLHHVGRHYDLTLNGRPFRIMVVGQEYGNGPARVARVSRSHDVVHLTGHGKRFRGDGVHPARNPHMRGTTSLLRLLFGRPPGSDYDNEFVELNGARIHIFESFALTNFLLCSAIAGNQGETGSKRGKSTSTMQRNCTEHFLEALAILEPSVLIAQGKGVRDWMNGVIKRSTPIGSHLESIRYDRGECLLASFTHPSVPSADNWGTDDRRPYLLNVIAPTARMIHERILKQS